MLGDLTAERNYLNGNTRLRFYQSNVNKIYIYHLYSLFNLYVKTGGPASLALPFSRKKQPATKEVVRKSSKLTGLIHTDIHFSTLKYPFFNCPPLSVAGPSAKGECARGGGKEEGLNN